MSIILDRYRKELLILIMLVITVVSLSTLITYKQLSNSLEDTYFNKLSVLKNSLSSHITEYFLENKRVLFTLSSSKTSQMAIEEFNNAFSLINKEYKQELNNEKLIKEIKNYRSKIRYKVKDAKPKRTVDEYLSKNDTTKIIQSLYISNSPFSAQQKSKFFSSNANLSYDKIHNKFHKYFLDEKDRYNYYDMFLINLNGDIIYSVDKEQDFATNLKNGVYSNSGLADVYAQALLVDKDNIVFNDFKAYEPSYNKPSAFMARAIYKDGIKIGVLAIQLSIDEINKVMLLKEIHQEIGLGDSGEAYLVGSDFFMRSDSRFMESLNNPLVDELATTVGVIKVDSLSVKEALKGNSSHATIKDYRGVEVLSCYAPVNVLDKKWAIVVELDKEEAFKTIDETIMVIIITSIVITILFLLILGYSFLRLILKPMEKQEYNLAHDIARKNKEIDSSQNILNEYKKAVDISSIISKTTPKGIITYINDAFCEISGYTREELIGKPHSIVRHPDMRRETFKELWDTILKKRVWKGVVKNLKKDGGTYYIQSSIIPILDENENIKEFISIRSDITELIQKDKQIQEQTTDATTSLPNRQKLMQNISRLKDVEMKLAIIQINKFKEINDFYGLDVGDHLLVSIATVLETIINKEKVTIYKIAGDEFAILECNNMIIEDFSKKITNIIKYFDHNVLTVNEDSFNISTTVGLATGQDSKIFFNTEMSLRKAVESSKSFLSFTDSSDLEKHYQENIKMTTKIKHAIKNDDIIVFTQSINANTNDGKEKYECLVRMRDGDKIISPFFFLEIAKKARLYPTITKIVIEKSFQHFKDSTSEFSINLTIDDILDDEIVSYLKRKIKDYKIAHRVVIELVESEGIENFELVSNFIAEVKALGCQIAIDDFGTGYSNFEYLMKLNVDYVKIDGSLIKNLDTDENSQVVVELIVDFAKRMNIKTIGEFVHNEAVYRKIKSMGIDYTQGYHLGEPKEM